MKKIKSISISLVLIACSFSVLAQPNKNLASNPNKQEVLIKEFTGSYVGSNQFGTLEGLDNKTFLTISPNKAKSLDEIKKVVSVCGDITTCHVKAKVLRVPTQNQREYDYFLIEALDVNKVE